jgi:uncharacterized protein YuzE
MKSGLLKRYLVQDLRRDVNPAVNVAYLRFRERRGDIETTHLTDDVLVDIDKAVAVCGVELLNAAKRLKAGDRGELAVA